MSAFPFNYDTTTEAARKFIDLAGGSIDKLKLNKLLYLLDKESIREHGTPVCGGDYYSLPHGPIISQALDVMDGASEYYRPPRKYWEDLIEDKGHNTMAATNTPLPGKFLSGWDTALIAKVHEQFKHFSGTELRDWCHDYCLEYSEIQNGRKELPAEEVIQHTIEDEENRQDALAYLNEEKLFAKVFGS